MAVAQRRIGQEHRETIMDWTPYLIFIVAGVVSAAAQKVYFDRLARSARFRPIRRSLTGSLRSPLAS
jgi:hypothetical protein